MISLAWPGDTAIHQAHAALGHAFTFDFRIYEDRLPLAPNGKFEEFVNLTDRDIY